jgi:hypothetical protein
MTRIKKCPRQESNLQPSASEAESTELQAGTCQELGQDESPLVPMLVPDDRKSDENGPSVAVSKTVEVMPEAAETDFVAAVKMLAMLPLSDAERAETIRRLLRRD